MKISTGTKNPYFTQDDCHNSEGEEKKFFLLVSLPHSLFFPWFDTYFLGKKVEEGICITSSYSVTSIRQAEKRKVAFFSARRKKLYVRLSEHIAQLNFFYVCTLPSYV